MCCFLQLRNVESDIKTKPVTQSDSTITYGPFEKKSPISQEELKRQDFKGSLKYRTGVISL